MKVLLGENLPHALRHHLPGHDVFTVAFQRWSGVKNGELLRLAASAGFDVMLTMDNGVTYQQNVHNLPVAVVVISARSNDIDDLLPLVPSILARLAGLSPRSIERVP